MTTYHCRHCGQPIYERPGHGGRYRWSTRADGTDTLGSGSECPANERGHERNVTAERNTTTTYHFDNGESRELDIAAEDGEITVVGLDPDGRVVVRYTWGYRCGDGYLFALTLCCNASDKGTESGVVCRACYGEKSDDIGVYNPIVASKVVAR